MSCLRQIGHIVLCIFIEVLLLMHALHQMEAVRIAADTTIFENHQVCACTCRDKSPDGRLQVVKVLQDVSV